MTAATPQLTDLANRALFRQRLDAAMAEFRCKHHGNYTFAMSESFDADYLAPFSNTNGLLTTSGVAHLDTSQRVTSQA
jgi:hypothetical protein